MRMGDTPERRLIQLLCGTADTRRAGLGEILSCLRRDRRRSANGAAQADATPRPGGRAAAPLVGRDIPELERELKSFGWRRAGGEQRRNSPVSRFWTAWPPRGSEPFRSRAVFSPASFTAMSGRAAPSTSMSWSPPRVSAMLWRAFWARLALGGRCSAGRRLADTPRDTGPLDAAPCRAPLARALVRAAVRRRCPCQGRRPSSGAPLEMQPLDGLIALMLFYARDGFAGLRLPADLATWWDLRCASLAGPSPSDFVDGALPCAHGAGKRASRLLRRLVGVPADHPGELPFRWRLRRSSEPIPRRGPPAGRGQRWTHRSSAGTSKCYRRSDAARPAQRAGRASSCVVDGGDVERLRGPPAARRAPMGARGRTGSLAEFSCRPAITPGGG